MLWRFSFRGERKRDDGGKSKGEEGWSEGFIQRNWTNVWWGGFRLLLRINLIRLRDMLEKGLDDRVDLYIIVRWRWWVILKDVYGVNGA